MRASVGKISDILYENKLIKNELLFKLLVKVSNKAPSIKSGTYLLNQSYSNNDIISLLVSGKIYQDGIKVTIPEELHLKKL
ncbi:endolytic transglycosylase MltG [Clostridioides difficile]|uniref:endolytic transglycosylase MltG n=1 Tax=Clostridioides difficile TaxID=1496 RepID=UPI001F1DB701|nr:endolytic transglycosylase MltG [Clostridioides difficile]